MLGSSLSLINWQHKKSRSFLEFVKKVKSKNRKKEEDDFWGVHLRRCKSIPEKVNHGFDPNVSILNLKGDNFHSLENVSVESEDIPTCAVNKSVAIYTEYIYLDDDDKKNKEELDENDFEIKHFHKDDQKILFEESDKKGTNSKCIKKEEKNKVQTPKEESNNESTGNTSDVLESNKTDFPTKVFHQLFSKKFRASSVGDLANLPEKIRGSSQTYHFCNK